MNKAASGMTTVHAAGVLRQTDRQTDRKRD